MSLYRTITVFLVSLMLPTYLFAQQIKVEAFADTTQIKLGEQFKLTISATGPIGTRFVFPHLNDTIDKHFDIVKKLKTDTILHNDKNQITLNQQYIVTSFDSGYWPIKPFIIYTLPDTQKSYKTEALLITVKSIPVDTTQAFKDIKLPYSAPISWQEWLPYVLGAVAIIVVFIIAWYLYKKYKNKPTNITELLPQKTPAQIALEQLDDLEQQKLWQAGHYKLYYSKITDILRTYLDQKYSLTTMEQVTPEVLKIMSNYLKNEEYDKLKRILQLADMVKFAKEIPLSHQCESALTEAKEIIQATSPVVHQTQETNV